MKKQTNSNFIITKTNHLIIECKLNLINGKFIIDTGASNSCINYLSAKKFNINFKKTNEKASSATDQIKEIFYSKNNLLEIDDFKKDNFEILLFDMSHINNSLNEKEIKAVDGIIGGDILNEFKAIIDYNNKTLTLKF